jgi:hypothetical protein
MVLAADKTKLYYDWRSVGPLIVAWNPISSLWPNSGCSLDAVLLLLDAPDELLDVMVGHSYHHSIITLLCTGRYVYGDGCCHSRAQILRR